MMLPSLPTSLRHRLPLELVEGGLEVNNDESTERFDDVDGR